MKNEHECQVEQEFYQAVARLLQTEINYRPFPHRKITRWNNRAPGNGRYPGFGLVRRFSKNLVNISLHTPKICATVYSEQAALEVIANAIHFSE